MEQWQVAKVLGEGNASAYQGNFNARNATAKNHLGKPAPAIPSSLAPQGQDLRG
jgi:hypothetical protein